MPVCASCGKENPAEARFCLACGTAVQEAAARSHGVRKTVTIVFCDLAGSTSLGERLDPESLRHVLARYHDEMRAVLERHGGTVEKFIGDAVMAVFGVPVVHEDDALRAVRAAVEMRTVLAALNVELERDRGVAIEVRTGVNTGEVVSGDSAAGSSFVTGDAVNVAARLEQVAAAGDILIGDSTYRLVRDAIVAEPVEALELKGKSGAVAAYRLTDVREGVLGVARRLDSPLVGRVREHALLAQTFDRVVEGRSCYLFTVLGPAGVGKTRLVSEFVSSVEADARVLSGRCLPYGDGITFWPIAEVVREAVGLVGGEGSEEARARVAAASAASPDGDLIAERVEQAIGLVDSTAETEETFWGIRRFLEILAADRPLVLVLDDIHWAESTLLDLIEHVADWSRDAPILILCMSRPELLDTRPGWSGGKMNATSILLEPLSEHDCDALIANLLGRASLSDDVRARITETAEGNPLFVEQMVAMLVDDGLLRPENNHWVPASDLSQLSVPPTIHALLAARLDRLVNEERAVIERASVEGKVFHRGAVATLAPELVRERLPAHLMALVRKELVRPASSDFPGEDAFRFRHILLRDAAYDALPKEVRADLHERFAGWLERAARDRVAEYEEIVGYHLEQAYRYRSELGPVDEATRAVASRAGQRLLAAGRRASSRGDASAAATLLERASALLPRDSRERIRVLPLLADALRDAGRAGDARSIYEEARVLAGAEGEPAVESRARLGLVSLRLVSDLGPDMMRETLAEADRANAVLDRLGDHEGMARAWLLVVATKFWTGHATEAEEALERAIAHARLAGDPRLIGDAVHWLGAISIWGPMPIAEGIRRGEELREAARPGYAEAFFFGTHGALMAMLGRFDEAIDLLERSERLLRDLGLRTDLASSHHAAEGMLVMDDHQGILDRLGPGLSVLRESGETGLLSTSAAIVANSMFELGRYEEADALARESEKHSEPNDIASEAQWRGVRAKLLARDGRAADAEHLAREGVAIAGRTDHITIHAQALLDLAETLRLSAKRDDAAAALNDAIALYERKGSLAGIARAQRKLEHLGSSPAS